MRQLGLNRRLFLLSSGACMLSSCVTCGEQLPSLPSDPSRLYSDAHVHFFNASDLPVENFIKYVFAAQYLRDAPKVVLALVDLAGKIVKGLAVTVEIEKKLNLNRFGATDPNFEEGPSTEDFSQKIATHINDGLQDAQIEVNTQGAQTSTFDPLNNLADSYLSLAIVLNQYGEGQSNAVLPDIKTRQALLDRIVVIPEQVTAVINDEAVTQQRQEVSPEAGIRVNGGLFNPTIITGGAEIDVWQTIKWIYVMTRSRCSHVSKYINESSPIGLRPSVVTNLLVDYDEWLGDTPADGSSHIAQVDFWSDYSKDIRTKVDIHTFGGFDPLKNAIQRAESGSTHLEALEERINDGRLSGFKLYPPMGFRAIGNKGANFSGRDGIGSQVVDRWQNNPNTRDLDLGESLDTSLMAFFDFCTTGNKLGRSIPLLAHASADLFSSSIFKNRADPKWWRQLISGSRFSTLRVCLGHFSDAAPFVRDMKSYKPGGINISPLWALQNTAALLDMSKTGKNGEAPTADFYVDVGYMSELLPSDGVDSELAESFFEALFKYCKFHDPKCERIMFGSDWIMLGREKNHKNYAAIMLRAMEKTAWAKHPIMMRNFFTNNLRRFLYLQPI